MTRAHIQRLVTAAVFAVLMLPACVWSAYWSFARKCSVAAVTAWRRAELSVVWYVMWVRWVGV